MQNSSAALLFPLLKGVQGIVLITASRVQAFARKTASAAVEEGEEGTRSVSGSSTTGGPAVLRSDFDLPLQDLPFGWDQAVLCLQEVPYGPVWAAWLSRKCAQPLATT